MSDNEAQNAIEDIEIDIYNAITSKKASDRSAGLLALQQHLKMNQPITSFADAIITCFKKQPDNDDLFNFLSHFILTNQTQSLEDDIFTFFTDEKLLNLSQSQPSESLLTLIAIYQIFISNQEILPNHINSLFNSSPNQLLAQTLQYLTISNLPLIQHLLQEPETLQDALETPQIDLQVAAAKLAISAEIAENYAHLFAELSETFGHKISAQDKKNYRQNFNDFQAELEGQFRSESVKIDRETLVIDNRDSMNRYEVVKAGMNDEGLNFWLKRGERIREFLGLGEIADGIVSKRQIKAEKGREKVRRSERK